MPFKNKEIESKSQIVDLLNSLKLEESEFLIEKRKIWNSAHLYNDWGEGFRKKNEEELERSLKIHSWNFGNYWNIEDSEDDYCTDSKHYYLEGPYGLDLEINKYFLEISIWVNRYYQWFNISKDFDVLWREKWRLIVFEIINILGGDYVMYFPDTSIYLPRNYCFPTEMEEYFKTGIKDLDQVVELISEKHSKPLTLAEADKMFETSDEDLFVIDRFDDIDKTLKI